MNADHMWVKLCKSVKLSLCLSLSHTQTHIRLTDCAVSSLELKMFPAKKNESK